MKKVIAIFLVAYYLPGVLLLPLGDLSAMRDLPEMFRHCRDTEDADLNAFEFLTEHVSPIGQLLEGIEHDDPGDAGDKPHAPVTMHVQQQISYVVYQIGTCIEKPIVAEGIPAYYDGDDTYLASYSSFVFRPPVAA